MTACSDQLVQGRCRPSQRLFVVPLVALLLATGASSASAQTWLPQSPVGGPPAVRMLASQGYDVAGDNVILFAGGTPSGYVTDTWVLANATSGSPTWTQLAPTGGPPQGRAFHSSIYAADSNRLVIYGGCLANCGFATSDVWTLTNANGTGGTPAWSPLTTSGSDGREGHVAVYDEANNRMIVFGGQNGFNTYGSNPQVRVLANADGTDVGTPTWSTLVPSNAGPSSREGVGLAYDAANNRLIVFGGYQLTCCAAIVDVFNDAWVLEHANGLGGTPQWTQLAPVGGPPSDRVFPSAVYDDDENRLIVFGGASGFTSTSYNDTWVLEHANGLGGTPQWAQLTPSGGPPEERHGHSVGFAPGSNSMVITMGRHDLPSFHMLNDTWVLNLDSSAPVITITTPADGGSYPLGSTVLAAYGCQDETGGSGLDSCVGTVAAGAPIDTATVGPKAFSVETADNAGNTDSLTHNYSVVFDFSGFSSPVDNPPVQNSVKAGQAIPIRFSLSGDQGLDIFATGYPKSEPITCGSTAAVDGIEETVTAGGSSLSYDSAVDQYTYVWKTNKTWANTCRQLVVKLDDGTSHRANFKFK
jgi:Galactose oxidase, central domain